MDYFDDDFDANIYDDDPDEYFLKNVSGVVVVANQEVEPVAAAVNRNPKDHARLRKAKLRKIVRTLSSTKSHYRRER